MDVAKPIVGVLKIAKELDCKMFQKHTKTLRIMIGSG
jgi:hypothetical protein